MSKQHHIVYERATDKYWFIFPDDTEKEVSPQMVNDIDFNIIYNQLYSLAIYKIDYYNFLKSCSMDFVIEELQKI